MSAAPSPIITDECRALRLYIVVKTKGWNYRQTRAAWNCYKRHIARAGWCQHTIPTELQRRFKLGLFPFNGSVKDAHKII